ncbi:ATP-grasp domain-containing protein [Mucilaginibacter arboris]|uniref:PylC N-terminal domain-containing protein n=1 Tax=Mucilaginibacter arboris TaxID=2682090 RepID=A0A7K1SU61_9SPHI|nr:hypothetical protein [Mucilaginibacter arboris]MVN20855.1 hypothetical protein [Mucilaginibacter arboris]
MTKALITCGQNPSVYFLEKWLPQYEFIYGDASFIAQIPSIQQIILPQVSQADYIHQVLNICLDNQIDAVFPMSFSEQELLAEATELFSEFNIQLHLPDLITRKLLSNPAEVLQKLNFSGIKTVPFRVTSSFGEFSKACLQLGYPTENIAVAAVENPDLVWLINDLYKTASLGGKPVISFTKAAKLFAANEMLLLRTFRPSTQKLMYASFTGEKLTSVWNLGAIISKETIKQIGTALQLNGLFEICFQEHQLFNLKPFAVV